LPAPSRYPLSPLPSAESRPPPSQIPAPGAGPAAGTTGLAATWTTATLQSGPQLAIDPVTGQIATTQLKGTVQIWDPATGKVARTLSDGRDRTSSAVAYSPDGSLLAGLGVDGRIWRADGTAAPRPLAAADGLYYHSMAFSPDGRHLVATARVPRSVEIWDVATGTRSGAVPMSQQVYDLVVAPDGRTVLVLTDDRLGVLELGASWDPGQVTTRWLTFARPLSANVGSLAISPDGRTVATSSRDYLSLWDLAGGTVTATLTVAGTYGSAGALAFSPDGTRLASGSGRGIEVWDLASRRITTTLDTAGAGPQDVAFLPDGRRVAAVLSQPVSPPQSAVSLWTLP
jgi:WD40 repeat protein